MDDDADDWEWRLAAARAAAEQDLEPDDGDDDWDWEIAVARARAQDFDEVDLARGSGTDVLRGVRLEAQRRTPPPPPRAKSSTQPLGSGAPRTVIAVPALPSVDPQLVRSYVRPRR